MELAATTDPEDVDSPLEPGPRCSTCERLILDEWINWQKCWSEPYIGIRGERRILAYPTGRDPIVFLLNSRATIENLTFWWYFICKSCREAFRTRGLCVENKEIEDLMTNVPLIWAVSSGKPGATRQFQTRPTFIPEDWNRNQSINGPLGVCAHWSPSSSPRSPASSSGFDPWMSHLNSFVTHDEDQHS